MDIYSKSNHILDELFKDIGKTDINELLKEHPPISKPESGEYNPFYGKKHTQETRNTIAECNRNRIWTDESRKKASKNTTGHNNPFYGKKHSNETKDIIGKKNKGNKGRTGQKNSESHNQRVSQFRMGKPLPEDTKKKMSESRRKYMMEKGIKTEICPICGKEGKIPSIYRHINKCKSFE